MRHNLQAARRRSAGRRLWAVVKANAYGHGIERAVRGFDAADGLALIDFDEARRARDAGWAGPLLLLEGVFEPGDIALCRGLGLTVVVHDDEQLRMFEAAPAGAPVGVYVKVNTGMNRLGFAPGDVSAACARLRSLAGVRIDGVSMHFANSDRADPEEGPVSMHEQLQRFDHACLGVDLPRCISNSAALFLHPPLAEGWARPGIALYGATPDAAHGAAGLGLRAAMTLATELIAVRSIAPGEAVGYGSRFVARRPTRIGVVACGYADGYPRHAPDGTPVAVDGVIVPLVGRVSMDMITVDLTDAPGARVGSAVELWGAQVPIDAVASHAGTVGYELMCALAPRVPVVAVD
jgi:alanine racemase